jgi:hypothetical protein
MNTEREITSYEKTPRKILDYLHKKQNLGCEKLLKSPKFDLIILLASDHMKKHSDSHFIKRIGD